MVLPARIRVVVVPERKVDGADPALLRRRAERRLLARAESKLADDGCVLDALDHLAEPLRLLAALDLHAFTVLERPPDRLLYLPLEADAEHDAVNDGGAVREVLDRREGDLGPQRDRAHHLAARLVRGELEGRPAVDRDVEVGAEGRRDVALLL